MDQQTTMAQSYPDGLDCAGIRRHLPHYNLTADMDRRSRAPTPARKRRSQPATMDGRIGSCTLGIGLAVVMLEGCGASQTGVAGAMTQGVVLPSAASVVQQPGSARGHIQHVVVVIQENRTFENFFAGFPGANAPMYGYALHGHKRVKVALHETTFETNPNLPHTWQSALKGWDNGKMDGFHTGRRN